MALWKKKKQKPYRERVAEFWDWFPTVAAEFATQLENDQSDRVVPEVQKRMNSLMPGLSWVFGPGPGGVGEKGHSFTVTGEGQIARQLLAEFWLSQQLNVSGWTFYGSRQPSSEEFLQNMAIGFGDNDQVDADTFLIRTEVDEEAEAIHIAAWHPAFDQLDEEHHGQILFIFLDEALGEFGTQTWIGNIEIEPVSEGKNTRPLAELPRFIDSVAEYHKWEKLSPLESYTGYQADEDAELSESPRGDTIVGTTCIPNVIFEFLENEGQLSEDPLEGTGAEFVYIAVDGSVFPDGDQVDVRSNIEDTINEALAKESSGRSLGGAFGAGESYVEFLLFDSENGRRIIEDTLQDLQLGGRSRIESFA
ncbi:MAG: hypothetical protein H8E37_13585 [Planctomycetes bacterium]|nr:hypothetical protein [Planctomycetota bacterium]